MGLITVNDLEIAMGTTFSTSEAARAQSIIDDVTALIEDETETYFSLHSDVVKRMQANAYGVIKIPENPVVNVTVIHDFKRDQDLTDPAKYWDGLSKLSGLYGYQVVDVTYSYGQDDVPADITAVAKSVAVRGMSTEATALKSKQVGDVIEQYGDMLPFNAWEQGILDSYGDSMGSWELSDDRVTQVRDAAWPCVLNQGTDIDDWV